MPITKHNFFHKEWFYFLHEVHEKNCDCSYCYGEDRMHYGLNIPKCKKWNSWWVIKYWNRRYFRWTNTFLMYITSKK